MKKLSLLFLSILSILLSCNKPPSLIGKWEMFIGSPSDCQSLGDPVEFSTERVVLVTEAEATQTNYRGSYQQNGKNLKVQVPLPIGTWVWQGKIVTLAKNKLVLRRRDGKLAAYHKVGEKWDPPPKGLLNRPWFGQVLMDDIAGNSYIHFYQVNFSSRIISVTDTDSGKYYAFGNKRWECTAYSQRTRIIKTPYHGMWVGGKYIIKGKGIPTFTLEKKLNVLRGGKFT